MADAEKSNDVQKPRPWYSHPAAKATFAILGVGMSLATLFVAVGLWVLSGINNPDDDTNIEGPNNRASLSSVKANSQDNAKADTQTGSEIDVQADSSFDKRNARVKWQEKVTLSQKTDFSRIIHGKTVELQEKVQTNKPVYIVAKQVSLSKQAVIHSRRKIWIFADKITGGTLNVSGVGGTQRKRDGEHAGSVYILANVIRNLTIRAVGGKGAAGVKGQRGQNGRNGRCGGFGRYRGAHRGGNGGVGGTGGRGGNGGKVRVVYGISESVVEVKTQLGDAGAGGDGGTPGRGGDGCVGLGGTQGDAANGSPGPPGQYGRRGIEGKLAKQKKEKLVDEILLWLRDRNSNLSVEALQYVKKAELDNSKL